MNESIHNEKVASFQQKVKSHENAIIEGEKVAHDLNEFIDLHSELNNIIDEYVTLSNQNSNPKYKLELDTYLKEELDYLDLIEQLMNNLENYHDIVGLVDSNMIQNEWEDVRIIVTVKNVERSLKRVSKLIELHPEETKYSELYNTLDKKYKKIVKKAVEAEHHMITRTDMEINSVEIDSKEVESDVLVNDAAYEKMNTSEKMDYLEKIMANMEKARGKKRTLMINGARKNIVKKYADRYLKYNAMLNNLSLEKEKEEQELEDLAKKIEIQTEQEIHAENVEEYWVLREEMQEIERAISVLEINAEYASEEVVVHVTHPNGRSTRVLKTDLDTYSTLEEKAKENETKFVEFMEQHGILTDAYLEGNSEDEKKQQIMDEINFLQKIGIHTEAIAEQIKDLTSKYFKVEKRKKFFAIANLTHLFKKQGYSQEEAAEMADAAYDPSELQNDKNVTNQEKNRKFSEIFKSLASTVLGTDDEALDADFVPVEEDNISLKDKIKMNAYKHVGGALGYMHGVAMDVKPYASKALKAIKSIPRKAGNFVSKIKNIKKPVNKEKLKEDVKKRAPQVAILLGFTVVMAATAYSSSKEVTNGKDISIEIDDPNSKVDDIVEHLFQDTEKQAEEMGEKVYEASNKVFEESVEQIQTQTADVTENTISETENVQIGGVFTTDEGAPIYTNMYDASKETNGKNAYFAPESNREITAIAYEYNGTTILLDMDDPDYEAKRTALETNGAVAVAVRSQNEASKGHEGYWNIDDINMGGRSK